MDDKPALRARFRRQRRLLTGADLAGSAESLRRHLLTALTTPPLRHVDLIAAYLPIGSEPGSEAALDDLRAAGHTVLLPVVRDDGHLDWAVHTGAVRPGPLGLREPAGTRLGPAAVTGADLVLVPALAADRNGTRLGRGAGYYDRALARVRRATPVAVLLHDGELVDALPAEPHDRPVGAAVTPSLGWVELG